MKRSQIRVGLILIVTLVLAFSVGCTNNQELSYEEFTYEEFTHSSGLADNGFWKNITALDHVELLQYVGISIPGEVHTISSASVQAEIDNILSQHTYEMQITDRPIEDGDTVNIDFVGSIDGVEFPGGSTDGLGTDVTIGVTSYIDDFLEQLIGHVPGESFDIEVTFPEDYGNQDLSGKDAVFAITINYILEMVTPELTDDFVTENLSSVFGFNTVTELEMDITENLQEAAIARYLQNYILENTTVTTLPEPLLKYQEYALIYYFQDYADYYGMNLEEFLINYMSISTTDELLEYYRDDNTETATFHLIVQAIAEDAGISVTDDDVVAYFKKYVGTDDYSGYEETYGLPYLKLSVLHQAVMDYIVEKAVLE